MDINNGENLVYQKKLENKENGQHILVLQFSEPVVIKSFKVTSSKDVSYLFSEDYIQNKQFGLSKKYIPLCLFLYITDCTLIFVAFYFINKFVKSFALKYFIYALVLGSICICVLPPFTIPDEKVHFCTANFYANVLTKIQTYNANTSFADVALRKCDNEFYPADLLENKFFTRQTTEFLTKGQYKKYYSYAFPKLFESPSGTDYITIKNDIIEAKRVFYFVPHIFGVMISRALNLNQFVLYYFSCFLSLLFCSGIVAFSFFKTKCRNILFYFLALNPFLLQQMSHFTYDGEIFTFALVFVLFIFNYLRSRKISDFILSVVFIFLLLPAKQKVYMPLVLLYLLLFWEKISFLAKKWFSNKKIFYASICVLSFALLCICKIYIKKNPAAFINGGGFFFLDGEYHPTLTYVLLHPFDAVLKVFYTFSYQMPIIFSTLIGCGLGIGTLFAPYNVIILYFIILCFVLLDKSCQIIEAGQRKLCFIICVLVFFFVYIGMFISVAWDSVYVLGVQGRYFIPILPLLFLGANSEKFRFNKVFDNSNSLCNVIPLYVFIVLLGAFTYIITA